MKRPMPFHLALACSLRPPRRRARSSSAQLVEGSNISHEFMDEYSFVDLINGLTLDLTSPYPVLLNERRTGKTGKLTATSRESSKRSCPKPSRKNVRL